MQDQQVVQACLSHAPQKPLTDGVSSGSVIGRLEQLDATGPRHPSKAGPKFAVVISNQIFRRVPIRGGFSKLLCHPGIRRRACHADMDHSSCLEEGVEEGKEWPKAKVSHL